MYKNRFYEIDLLRFIAAVMVMLFHYAFRGYAADNMTTMPYPILSPLARYGYLGVNLFFIISGFVIFMTASNGCYKRFVISRIVRLYPAFWVCCTATFIITIIIGGSRYNATVQQYIINMTMLSGFLRVPSIDGAYWSLFVEMKFYFIIFMLLLFGLMKHAEVFLCSWLVVTLALIKWPVPILSYVCARDFAPYFIAGSMYFLVRISGGNFIRYFVLITCYVVAIWQAISQVPSQSEYYNSSFEQLIIAIIISSFFLVFLLISLGWTKWLSHPRWMVVGALTYPLYLIHQHVGFMLFNVLYQFANPHIIMWATVLIMLSFAYGVNTLIEKRYSNKLKIALSRLVGLEN